jgi:hypothetical protein
MLMIETAQRDITEPGSCGRAEHSPFDFRRYQVERGPRVKRHLRSPLPCSPVSTFHLS